MPGIAGLGRRVRCCRRCACSLVIPIGFQPLSFFFGDGGHGAMLLLGEVGAGGGSVAEVAERAEGLEVGGLHEAEVVGPYAEDVVHQQPAVLAV